MTPTANLKVLGNKFGNIFILKSLSHEDEYDWFVKCAERQNPLFCMCGLCMVVSLSDDMFIHVLIDAAQAAQIRARLEREHQEALDHQNAAGELSQCPKPPKPSGLGPEFHRIPRTDRQMASFESFGFRLLDSTITSSSMINFPTTPRVSTNGRCWKRFGVVLYWVE